MKAVIFDMDGLMFDTERVFIEAWDYAGEKIGIGKAGYMTIKTLGMNKVQTRKIWQQEFKNGYDEQGLQKYTKEFLQNYYKENKVPIKYGLYLLLDYLKEQKVKMAVASSSSRWEVESHLKQAEVFDYFQGIVCGDMIQNSKPDPEIYIAACKLIGERPEDCYALEDSKSGIISAYHAGCKTIMVPDLWQPDNEMETMIIGKFENLKQVKEYFMLL